MTKRHAIQYTAVERRAMRRQVERWIREARRSWLRGEALIILPLRDYLQLKGKR